MINHEENLKIIIDQQKQLLVELQELNNQVNIKRESLIKLQGIIEYLTNIGINLPQETSELTTSEEALKK